jgi:hypothetical protein
MRRIVSGTDSKPLTRSSTAVGLPRTYAAEGGWRSRIQVILPPPPTPAAGRLPEKGGGARVDPDGREALGRSRGGPTSNVHLLADDPGPAADLADLQGQRGDSPMFVCRWGDVPCVPARGRIVADGVPAEVEGWGN